MNLPQNSSAKGGATPAQIGPLSQNPIVTNNPIAGSPGLTQQLPQASYGPGGGPAQIGPLSQNPIMLNNPVGGSPPLSQQLPNATMGPPAQPPGLLGMPPSPQAGQAAQTAGGNAQAAMQAAMQGRPVAPTLPATSGAGLLGSYGQGSYGPGASAPTPGSAQAGGGNIGQMLKGMNPQTVANLMKLLA